MSVATVEPVVAVAVDDLRAEVAAAARGLTDVDISRVADPVLAGVWPGATYADLRLRAMETAAALVAHEPAYSRLAARLLATHIAEEAETQGVRRFRDAIAAGHRLGLIADDVAAFVAAHADSLDALVDSAEDPVPDDRFEYFGLRTVYDRYVLRHPGTRQIIETAQHFLLRVACGLMGPVGAAGSAATALDGGVAGVAELYSLMSRLAYLPSSPQLFNAGARRPQLSSCFLLDSPRDELDAIYERYTQVARLSKYAGGIGISWSRIRSRGSLIRGTNGLSNGIVPWLRTFDSSVAAVNQGGRRKGAACVYLEPWHADVDDFLQLRDSTGDEARRTHNLHLANWVPDEFMRRVEADEQWSLFDPKQVPHLVDLWGEEFDAAYRAAEAQGLAVKRVAARDLYGRMMRTLAQTGNGWMTFKDQANRTSNQTAKPGNVIHLSNLCTEILEVTSDAETAVCNLGSLNLAAHISTDCTPGSSRERSSDCTPGSSRERSSDCTPGSSRERSSDCTPGSSRERSSDCTPGSSRERSSDCTPGSSRERSSARLDFDALRASVRTAVAVLDRTIDLSYYPTQEAARANRRWRPIGLGVMGLADVFFQLRLDFDSPQALELSTRIAEEIALSAYEASADLAARRGRHETYDDTRAALGVLHVDHWAGARITQPERWAALRERVARDGLRNSLLIAIAPTATIASIAGCAECIEPVVSNLFKRETLSGEFLQVNRYLVEELKERGLWTASLRDQVMAAEGSIAGIEAIPAELRSRYRTAWELPQRALIDLAAARTPFVDQSQSLNLFMAAPTIGRLSSMYAYAWRKGLKTTYYLRSRPATSIAKTTLAATPATAPKPAGAIGRARAAGIAPSKSIPSAAEGAISSSRRVPLGVITLDLENPEVCEACQ